MNIKALPSMGNAFFVAFVLWSRRFAVPLQKESSPLQGVHLSQVHQQSRSAPTELYYDTLATLVHLRQVHPLKAPPERWLIKTKTNYTEIQWNGLTVFSPYTRQYRRWWCWR